MDGTSGKSDEEILEEHLKKVRRQELWAYVEKPSKEFLYAERFSDKRIETIDESADIINVLNRRNQLHSLYKALAQLKEPDRIIIEEFYFDGYKTKSELARLHKISRQVYTRKLNRAINRLRVIFMNIYENF